MRAWQDVYLRRQRIYRFIRNVDEILTECDKLGPGDLDNHRAELETLLTKLATARASLHRCKEAPGDSFPTHADDGVHKDVH